MQGMRSIGLFEVRAPLFGLVVMLLGGSLGGCSQEKTTPVGGVLDYHPANDPTISAAEGYMKQGQSGGMEKASGKRGARR
jgi:hypothetical protein